MPTVSLKLPTDLSRKLTVAAKRQKTTKSALVREALESFFAEGNGAKFVSCLDLAGDLVGSLDSGIPDLATNKKHMEGYGR
jgi:hypothetical protein